MILQCYNANPDLIIGKEITVQYFEETKNQKGELSLRFPTVKHVFENGRNVQELRDKFIILIV